MIRIEHLSKTFYPAGASKNDSGTAVHALQDISLQIPQGEYVIVIGANGSGKSTLLNAIAGSFLPDAGEIYLQEESVTRLANWQRSRYIARLFQNPLMGTAPELSILENFRLAALRTQTKRLSIGTGKEFRISVADSIAKLGMGLENRLDRAMGSLSGGQRQALTLLMSTMDDCKILLMDEPCSALDPRSSELIMELADKIIREQQRTALLVTHRLKDCIAYGDRVIFMEEGAISKDYTGNEKQQLTMEQLYAYFL